MNTNNSNNKTEEEWMNASSRERKRENADTHRHTNSQFSQDSPKVT